MSNYKLRWQEKRARLKSRSPWMRLDNAAIEKDEKGYLLVVGGFGLKPGPTVPEVTIGDEPVSGLRFQADGRRMTGRLARLPESNVVVVNIGPGLQGKVKLESP